MIRAVNLKDFKRLKELWDKFYSNEFTFPDFMNGYLCAFTAENDKNEIICAGGTRTIVEMVCITDKDASARDRYKCLNDLLLANKFVAGRSGYNHLNAFTSDTQFEYILKKMRFREEKILSLEL